MKNNTVRESLPALTMPRLSSKLEAVADNLMRFALEFGIEIDDTAPGRMATIGFANAIMLGIHDAGCAGKLEELLDAEEIPLRGEIEGMLDSYIAECRDAEDWTASVNGFLSTRWEASADCVPNPGNSAGFRLRVLHAIKAGLVVARECREAAEKAAERINRLSAENQFLASCLFSWSGHDWEPYWHPFVEFMASWYRPGSVERWVMRTAVAEVVPIAKALNDSWGLPFWAETGWNGGRNFVRNHQEQLKDLLNEAGGEILKAYHGLYERCVLGTARCGGEIDIGRATLRYIGELNDGSLARSVCTGREPRRLARQVYDFAFWMGIYSAQPLPASGGSNA